MPTTAWALLVWSYQVQMAHLRDRGDHGSSHGDLSPTGVVVQRLKLGTTVDCSRRSFGSLSEPDMACHDDARLVHSRVLSMGYARTLIAPALAGTPPRWQAYIEPFRVGPVLRGNGKPRMAYANHRPVLCLLQYEGTRPERAAELTRFARRCYAEWWLALSSLYDTLKDDQGLKRWRVADVGAPIEPWNKNLR